MYQQYSLPQPAPLAISVYKYVLCMCSNSMQADVVHGAFGTFHIHDKYTHAFEGVYRKLA